MRFTGADSFRVFRRPILVAVRPKVDIAQINQLIAVMPGRRSGSATDASAAAHRFLSSAVGSNYDRHWPVHYLTLCVHDFRGFHCSDHLLLFPVGLGLVGFSSVWFSAVGAIL